MRSLRLNVLSTSSEAFYLHVLTILLVEYRCSYTQYPRKNCDADRMEDEVIHHGKPHTNHLGVSLALRKCQTRYNFSKRCRTGGKYETYRISAVTVTGVSVVVGSIHGPS